MPSSSAPAVRRFSLAALPAWAPPAFVFVATFLAYLPVFHAGFVWNDLDYVTNPQLRSWHGLWRIWFEVGCTEQHYPLLHSTFWLEHRLWGDAPLGYHLVNLLLQAGSACLFGVILRRLSIGWAWFGALLFALHPLCAESVAWVSEQKNTLSTFLYLAAALVYLRFDEDRRPRDYRLATILFALALFAKSLTATLPPALLVVFWWKRGTLSWRRDVAPLLPWFLVGAAMGLFSSFVEHTFVGASGPDFDLTPLQRVLVAGRSLWFYFFHTFWPTRLIFIYPRWHVNPASLRQWLYPFAAVLFTLVLWLLRHRSRAPLAAWLFFAGSLFPVMGFFSLYAYRYSFIADHWQYQPMIGLVAFAAGAAARLPALFRRPIVWLPRAAAAALLLVCGVLTWRATLPFHDIYTFYQTILARNPDCWMASTNLGNLYLASGNNDAAIDQFKSSLRQRPDLPGLYLNLGDADLAKEKFERAIAYYEQALKRDPNIAEAHNNLASAALRLGRVAVALDHFQRALKLNPDYPEALCNFGYLLTKYGQPSAALEPLRHALRLRPNYPSALDNLGSAYLALGRTDAAIRSYQTALQQNPDFDSARNNLGNAFLRAGRINEAMAAYKEILRRHPTDTGALVNLGNALLQSNRAAEALPHYQAALLQNPAMPEAHNNYGFALLQLGQIDAAIAQFERALALQPGYADATNNLARARHELEARAAGTR